MKMNFFTNCINSFILNIDLTFTNKGANKKGHLSYPINSSIFRFIETIKILDVFFTQGFWGFGVLGFWG